MVYFLIGCKGSKVIKRSMGWLNHIPMLAWGGVVLVAGLLIVWWTVISLDGQMRLELLDEAHLATSFIDFDAIKNLSGQEADLNTANYQTVKRLLTSIHAADSDFRFIYLLGRRPDGEVFFYIDSEPADSADNSPPGQVYPEASPLIRAIFDNKTAALEGPFSDRWGTWISALVPVIDPTSGEVFAVVGIDVNAQNWYLNIARRSAMPIGLVVVMMLLGATYLRLYSQNKLVHAQQDRLRESENQFRALFEGHSATMLLLDPHSGKILDANRAAGQFYGYSVEQLKSKLIYEFNLLTHDQVAVDMDQARSRQANLFHFQHKIASGEVRDVEVYSTPIETAGQVVLFSIIYDVTERRRVEQALQNEHLLLRTLIDNIPDSVYMLDLECRKTLANVTKCALVGRNRNLRCWVKMNLIFTRANWLKNSMPTIRLSSKPASR